MIQVSLFRSSHRASWSYHRLADRARSFCMIMSRKFWNRFSWHQTPFTAICMSQKIDTNERNELKPERGEDDPQRLLDGRMPVFSRPFLKRFERVYSSKLTRHGLIGSTLLPESEVVTRSICITHAAIKTGSSNYHTEIFLVLIIFKSEE